MPMSRELRSPTVEPRSPRTPFRALTGRGGPEFFTIPNALTVLRVLLVPVFLSLYFADDVRKAALVFAAAAVSDALDGLLARLLNQRTAFGAILDPFADKLLGLASLVALVIHHRLPAWLLVVSLVRDAVVVCVALLAASRGVTIAATPTRVGKYATLGANAAVIAALIWEIAAAPWMAGYVLAVAIVAAECMAVAAVQYSWRFAAGFRRR